MKYSDFEKYVGKELGSSEDTVDMDALLRSLNLAPKKKSRTWSLLLFLIPFAAAGAITMTYLTLQEKSDEALASGGPTREVKLSSTADKETASSDDYGEDISDGSAMHEDDTSEGTHGIFDQVERIEHTAKAPRKVNDQGGTDNFKDEWKPKYEPRSQQIDNPLSATYPKMTMAQERYGTTVVEPGGTSDIYSQSAATYSAYDQGKSAHERMEEGAVVEASTSLRALDNPLSHAVSPLQVLERQYIGKLQSLDHEDSGLFSRMKINCPSFSEAYWRVALVPEVGYFVPVKSLSIIGSEVPPSFVKRQASEQTLEGINLGLYGMVVRDRSPLYFKAGISYSRISERMDLQYEYTVQDTTVGIVSTTISANGDTITHIYGDIITETVYRGKNRQHHYLHLFDVPVSMGYTAYVGGFDVGIEAGVRINLMTRATGNLLATGDDFTNVSLNRLFKNRIDLSYFGGLMIGRNFGRFGDFFIAPRFTYFSGNFNNEVNPVRQRYVSMGLNAGVVYKLK